MNRSKIVHKVKMGVGAGPLWHHLRIRLGFVVALLGLAAASCQNPSSKSSLPQGVKDEGKQLFAARPAGGPSAPGDEQPGSESKWSVLLLKLSGDQRDDAAPAVLRSVRASGVPEAFSEPRGATTLILAGRFDSPGDAEAQALLKRVKEISIEGQNPYASAYLLPPLPRSMKGSIPEWDLRNAHANFGAQAEYTLQINMYTNPRARPSPSELQEFRKAAEDAVRALRREGVEAFYYHDQSGSSVTVGLFSRKDLEEGQSLKPGASKSLREEQERFPVAMINGAGIKDHGLDSQGKPVEQLRPSFLVKVPD